MVQCLIFIAADKSETASFRMLQDRTPEDSIKLFFNMTVCITTVGYRTRSLAANDLETLLYLEGPRLMWSEDESELRSHSPNYVLIIPNGRWDSGKQIHVSVRYQTSYYLVGKSRKQRDYSTYFIS